LHQTKVTRQVGSEVLVRGHVLFSFFFFFLAGFSWLVFFLAGFFSGWLFFWLAFLGWLLPWLALP
jgi:hypothetical protein